MPKSAVRPINSSKNKLNSEIILIFHFNPNILKVTWDFACWICLFYHKYSTRLIDIVWFDVIFAELFLNVLYFLQAMQLLMVI